MNDNKIKDNIKKLKSLFIYNKQVLIYNKNIQEEANKYLEEIATLSGYFDKSIQKEKKFIQNNMTIIDKITGQKVELIESKTIDSRIKEVLKDNNMYSCLKSLALANKCAHRFDSYLTSIRSNFENYYTKLYTKPLNKNQLSFIESFDIAFNYININNLYNLNDINDNDIDKLCNSIMDNKTSVSKKVKISTLRTLNIEFNIRDDNDINIKYSDLLNHKDKLINSILYKKYNEGVKYLEFQNQLFSVKDNYISMIGQLLKTSLSNIKYELIKTHDATPGFEYMLIIDDPELSYYIEVHMPNFMAFSLIHEYGLKYSKKRLTENSGATAVYKRKRNEIDQINKALHDNSITDDDTRKKANIIARGHNNEIFHPEDDLEYSFATRQITDKLSDFEKFLHYKKIHTTEIEKNRLLLLNENYPEYITKNIVFNNYLNIFNTLTDIEKTNFIEYSLKNLQYGDEFDKNLLEQIKNLIIDNKYILYKLDIIGKILIYKNNIKNKYIKINTNIGEKELIYYDINKIKDYIYSHNNKKRIEEYIYSIINNEIKKELLNNYIYNIDQKEIDNEKKSKR